MAALLDSPDAKMFLLQAEDRLGPLGQSGLLIFTKTGATVEVDTFLMSCRLIGRLLDRALFCESLSLLRKAWSFDELHASFIPTKKNGIVSGLWQEYGFSRRSTDRGERYACLVTELKVSFPDVIQLAEHS
jgi:predicted enzyme involved in methoxymalonyl-ACP biosynthesis